MRRRNHGFSKTTESKSTETRTRSDPDEVKKSSFTTSKQAHSLDQSHYSILPAFILLSLVRVIAALTSPIADCDETFNYWEPMHYLLFGYGFQTWEYSPEFALRSYAYLMPYAFMAKMAWLIHQFFEGIIPSINSLSPKIFAFYSVRIVQGIFTAFLESHLSAAVNYRFGYTVNRLFIIFLLFSPGMFRSTVEFLPSSFAMICLIAAFTAWIYKKNFIAVFAVALGSFLGWIFAAVLAIPMAMHMLWNGFLSFFKHAFISGTIIATTMIIIDSYYFGKLVFAPLNHVLYNVFPKEGAGSQIFGVDSWKFYAFNLFLNTNVTVILYGSYPILWFVKFLFSYHDVQKRHSLIHEFTLLCSSYIALAIFFSQPHKEERFLAPCYPFIALTAAVAAKDYVNWVGNCSTWIKRGTNGRRLENKSSTERRLSPIKLIMYAAICFLTIALGISRIAMQIQSFHAPLRVYQGLSQIERSRNGNASESKSNANVNVCVGKEWYRFPNSFFLPYQQVRIRFVRSGFTGLLPKPYSSEKMGTRILPKGMNAFNKEASDQFFDWNTQGTCHYIIDLDLNDSKDYLKYSSKETGEENKANMQIYMKEKFLDSERSVRGYRAFLVPGSERKLVYGDYLLIKNSDLPDAPSTL